jgi:hypothetical protein
MNFLLEPKPTDAVLGSVHSYLSKQISSSAVLGGLEGVKRRIAHFVPYPENREYYTSVALDALKYGVNGLSLLMKTLENGRSGKDYGIITALDTFDIHSFLLLLNEATHQVRCNPEDKDAKRNLDELLKFYSWILHNQFRNNWEIAITRDHLYRIRVLNLNPDSSFFGKTGKIRIIKMTTPTNTLSCVEYEGSRERHHPASKWLYFYLK